MSSRSFSARGVSALLIVVAAASGGGLAHAQAAPAQSRGELLYTTHCIACHSSELHWRNNRRAKDWDSLKAQVRLWQGNTGLQWGEADISAVAGYLNDTIYHYPQTANRVGMMAGRPTGSLIAH